MQQSEDWDPLQLLLTLCCAKFITRYKKIYKHLAMLLYICAQLYGLISLIVVIELYGWRGCFPYLVPITIVQTGLTIQLITVPFVENMVRFRHVIKTKCRSYSSGSRKIQKKILIQSSSVKIYCVCNLILATITSTSFLPIFEDDKNFNSYYITFIKYFGQPPKGITIACMGIPLIISGITTNWVATITLYIAYKVKFQLDLLRDFIKHEIVYTTLTKTENYQEIAEEKLKECAEYYENLQRACGNIFSAGNITFLFLSIFGLVTFVAQFSFIYMNVSPASNWRMTLAILTSLSQFISCCIAGQILNEGSNSYHYSLYCCPWYQWKVKTQKILLIMLPNGLKPLSISSFGILLLNKEYILKGMRVSYSFLTVARKFKEE